MDTDSINLIIGTGNTYPDTYFIQYVTEIVESCGGVVTNRAFGDYSVTVPNPSYVIKLMDEVKKREPSWVVVALDKKGSPMSLDKESEETPAVEEAESEPETPVFNLESLMAEAAAEFEEPEVEPTPEPAPEPAVEIPEETYEERSTPAIKHSPLPARNLQEFLTPYTKKIIPPDCLGECVAFTDDYIRIEEVPDDAYCIEHNWEKRGDYWIIDVTRRHMRYVHSDKHVFNHEFNLGDCDV
jgi:hypothetical protein